MSKLDRGDRIALIALGMALIAIVLAAWFSQPIGNYVDESGAKAEHKQQEAELSEFSGQIFGDTYAQWIMAIFSIAATGVSFLAVVWVKRTLLETRRIGQAQVRAYVLARGIEISFVGGKFIVRGEIVNTGQSPALGVENWHEIVIEKPPFNEGWLDGPYQFYSKSDLGAGEPISIKAIGPNEPFPGLLKSVSDGDYNLWVHGLIRYKDVFGSHHSTRYRYDVTVTEDGRISSHLSNKGNSAT